MEIRVSFHVSIALRQRDVQRLMGEGARVGEIERRKKILEAMTYVRNNLDWIANIPKGKGYGSGPVEKTVDIPVVRRLKKRRMN